MSVRRKYLDRIRLFAAFLVVLMHTTTLFSGFRSLQYPALLWLNQLSGIAIPLFLLVTGSLILKEPFSLKKQISLSVKMLIMYFIFGVIDYISIGNLNLIGYIINPFSFKRWIGIGLTLFVFFYYIISKRPMHVVLLLIGIYFLFSVADYALTVDKSIIDGIFNSDSYRWYLILITGVYMIQPILYKIANDKKSLRLALGVGAIYALLYNLSRMNHFSLFGVFINDMAGAFAYRVIFYILLGKYMVDFMLSHDSFRLKRVKIYAVVLIIISTILQMNIVLKNSYAIGDFYMGQRDFFSIFVMANSVLVYILIYNYAFSKTIHKICGEAALYMYLWHLVIMKFADSLFHIGSKTGTFGNAILYSLIIYCVSMLMGVLTSTTTKLLKRFLGKKRVAASGESL